VKLGLQLPMVGVWAAPRNQLLGARTGKRWLIESIPYTLGSPTDLTAGTREICSQSLRILADRTDYSLRGSGLGPGLTIPDWPGSH